MPLSLIVLSLAPPMKSLSSSRHCQENVNTQRKSRKQQSIINKDRIEHHNNLSLSHLSLSSQVFVLSWNLGKCSTYFISWRCHCQRQLRTCSCRVARRRSLALTTWHWNDSRRLSQNFSLLGAPRQWGVGGCHRPPVGKIPRIFLILDSVQCSRIENLEEECRSLRMAAWGRFFSQFFVSKYIL